MANFLLAPFGAIAINLAAIAGLALLALRMRAH